MTSSSLIVKPPLAMAAIFSLKNSASGAGNEIEVGVADDLRLSYAQKTVQNDDCMSNILRWRLSTRPDQGGSRRCAVGPHSPAKPLLQFSAG